MNPDLFLKLYGAMSATASMLDLGLKYFGPPVTTTDRQIQEIHGVMIHQG
jgi:hypothetical protein